MDVDMGGADDTSGAAADKVDEGAESEDLEAESSGESDEEPEDEAEEDDGAMDVEMGDAVPANAPPTAK